MAADEQLRTDDIAQPISAGKVEGTALYNRSGEKLGTLRIIMIHKLSGEVHGGGIPADDDQPPSADPGTAFAAA